MIRRPGRRAVPKLYQLGLAIPELRTAPDEPFMGPDEFEQMVREHIFLAAYDGGKPVGFVSAALWEGRGCVVYLAVDVRYRGKRWGRRLVDRVLDELHRAGAQGIYAWVRVGSAANDLVDCLGFRRGGQFTYVFRGPG